MAEAKAISQKLGFFARIEKTAPMGWRVLAAAGRFGSLTTRRKIGAITTPAMPSTMKAARQSTALAMAAPRTTPAASPTGMPSE